MLKAKSLLDAEAQVLEHLPGAGRHRGRLGALMVQLSDGTRFSVGMGFSDAERGSPPPIGSVVTFCYQELSDGGVPRFPSYVGVREDAAWPGTVPSARPPMVEVPAPAATAQAPGAARRFELAEGTASKFWEVSRDGGAVTVRYGRIGGEGQAGTKELASEGAARDHVEGLIAEKEAKGHRERGGE